MLRTIGVRLFFSEAPESGGLIVSAMTALNPFRTAARFGDVVLGI